eukprot:5350430-Pleurochrysis_carterae.AAC.1
MQLRTLPCDRTSLLNATFRRFGATRRCQGDARVTTVICLEFSHGRILKGPLLIAPSARQTHALLTQHALCHGRLNYRFRLHLAEVCDLLGTDSYNIRAFRPNSDVQQGNFVQSALLRLQ